jgi:hypothetical protein
MLVSPNPGGKRRWALHGKKHKYECCRWTRTDALIWSSDALSNARPNTDNSRRRPHGNPWRTTPSPSTTRRTLSLRRVRGTAAAHVRLLRPFGFWFASHYWHRPVKAERFLPAAAYPTVNLFGLSGHIHELKRVRGTDDKNKNKIVRCSTKFLCLGI